MMQNTLRTEGIVSYVLLDNRILPRMISLEY